MSIFPQLKKNSFPVSKLGFYSRAHHATNHGANVHGVLPLSSTYDVSHLFRLSNMSQIHSFFIIPIVSHTQDTDFEVMSEVQFPLPPMTGSLCNPRGHDDSIIHSFNNYLLRIYYAYRNRALDREGNVPALMKCILQSGRQITNE